MWCWPLSILKVRGSGSKKQLISTSVLVVVIKKKSTTGLSSREPIWRSELNSPWKRKSHGKRSSLLSIRNKIKTPGRYHHTEGRGPLWETQQTITADEGAGKRQYKMSYFMRRTCTHVLLQEIGGVHRDLLDLLSHKVQNTRNTIDTNTWIKRLYAGPAITIP